MAIKTISKNGKRVPASEKGKGKKKSAPNFQPKLDMNGKHGKKPRSPAPHKSGVVRRPKEAGPAGKSPPIWENLDKPWSLTTCRRVIAIAVEHNNALSKRAALKEQLKYVKNELEADNLSDAEEKKYTQKLWHLEQDIDSTKQREKAATADMVRICIESVGGTVFEQSQDRPAKDDGPDEDGLYTNGSEHVDKHDGSTAEIKPAPTPARELDDADFQYVHKPIEHLRTAQKHGQQIVSDAAIACLRRAGLEQIRDINSLDLPGLTKGDAQAIEAALEMFATAEQMAGT